MANKYFYTYIHDGKNDSLLPKEVATAYWNSLIFDVNHRTIWHQGMPFGNVYPGTASYGEVFNSIDFNVAKAAYSHAEGWKTTTTYTENDTLEAIGAHAEGTYTIASAESAHAEGQGSESSGVASHTEGVYTNATEEGAHAEGHYTYSLGTYSHTEGTYTMAFGIGAHAEGGTDEFVKGTGNIIATYSNQTFAIGKYSHAEGTATHAIGDYSHTEGSKTSTTAAGISAHAEGESSKANGQATHAEGQSTANGNYAHAEGQQSVASGIASHAEGQSTTDTNATYAHAEGQQSVASGIASHAEGQSSNAIGSSAHSEGNNTTAKGISSHAEGDNTNAIGDNSHTEGSSTEANGISSHAEGINTKSTIDSAHSEGNDTEANGISSHAEGSTNITSGNYSHIEGYKNKSEGVSSHIEGTNNQESGTDNTNGTNHVQGNYNIVKGTSLNVQGNWNQNVNGSNSSIIGTYNNTYTNTSFIVGSYTYIPYDERTRKVLNNVFVLGNNLTPTNDNEIITGNYARSYENGAGDTFTNNNGVNHTIFSIGYGNANVKQNAFDVRTSGTAYLYNISYTWDNGDDDRDYKKTFPEGLYPIATTSYVMYHGVGKRNWSKDDNGNFVYTNAEYFNDYENNKAYADYAHAEGTRTYASGISSHAEGKYTETYNEAEHASGKYNKSYNGQDGTYTLFTVGNGASILNRSNAFTILDTSVGAAPNGVAFIEDKPIITGLVGDIYNTTSKATYIWTGKYSEYNTIEQYKSDALYFVEDGDGSTRDDFITSNDMDKIIEACKTEVMASLNGIVKNASVLSSASNIDLQEIGKASAGTTGITTYIWTGSKTDYDSISGIVDKILNKTDDNITEDIYQIVKHMQFIIHPDE